MGKIEEWREPIGKDSLYKNFRLCYILGIDSWDSLLCIMLPCPDRKSDGLLCIMPPFSW